ncbi:hypothetical protein HOY80DRAFT_1035530 [Tuber brumale]|nr:hypothetical protein HOY80DRAFT_1035530 [Tuber brumale]
MFSKLFSTFAAHPMAWATVFTGAAPTLITIVDNRVTRYQEGSEARKKEKEMAGRGAGGEVRPVAKKE